MVFYTYTPTPSGPFPTVTPRQGGRSTPIPTPTPTPDLGCPVERGAIKGGTDPDAHLVDLASVKSTTVNQMRQWVHPAPSRRRVSPYETSVWSVDAVLTGYKLEEDSDYHLVLQDSTGHTMIVEIPSPNCAIGSVFESGIANARREFDSQFSANLGFTATSVPVHVSGVGFFDFVHGQQGVAPNGIELHPVLEVSFAPTGAPGFDLWVDRDSLAIAKNSAANIEVRTIPGAGFNSSISLSVPPVPGFTASLSSNVLSAPGSGSSFITISTHAQPPTGRHSFTLNATGSGVSRSVTLTVNVVGERLPVNPADSQRSPRVVERD